MVNYEFIGARIREARLRKKLSQEQLAAMVDVGTSHISHIETGATIPSTKLLVQLMNIYSHKVPPFQDERHWAGDRYTCPMPFVYGGTAQCRSRLSFASFGENFTGRNLSFPSK